jgi:putative ABC transport system permease protein
MTGILDDIRSSARLARRSPGTVALAVLSLTLGIGANTAVFSFVNAIQFRPLPVADESTLVDVSETSATELCAGCGVGTSYPTYVDRKKSARSFTAMEAYREERFVVSGGTGPERVGGALASAGLFDVLGVRPATSRALTPSDDDPAAPPTVVISDRLWQRRFAGRGDITGEPLKVNGIAHTIVGVMPAGFRFPEFAELWIPLTPAARDWKRDDRSLAVLARLGQGVAISQARAEMRTLAADVETRYSATNRRWTAAVVSLREDMTAETAQASVVLLSAVGFVLLIACANVANLLLVRASERRREVAIRVALGASRLRILRLLVVEGLTLAASGGVFGWLLALWASDVLVATFGAEVPYWIQFGIDWHVYVFTVLVTVATGLLCGLAPAIQASRAEPQAALKDGGAIVGGGSGRRFRSVLNPASWRWRWSFSPALACS